MEQFWNGFEKRAHGGGPVGGFIRFFQNLGRSAKNIKIFSKQMAKPTTSTMLENLGNAAKKVSYITEKASKIESSKFVKDVGSAARNFNALSAEVRKTNDLVSKAIPKVEEHLEKGMEYLKQSIVPEMNEKADIGLEYLKKGLLGAGGIYAASKALALPGEYHKYKYYMANQNLANQRLKDKRKGPALPVTEGHL